LLLQVDVQLQLVPDSHAVLVRATAVTVGQTGVEMEALTAAGVAGLVVYDMCKAVSKDIVLTDLQLDYKEGGKSGTYVR
jgi:cyclic pyranopterin phosphate synthase